MKTKLRLKIIWESTITRVMLIILLIIALLLAIILPSTLSARPKDSVTAFNRDATSGTREAFVEKVLQSDMDDFSPGSNVLEASNNESMIRSVERNRYSTGYVSFGTVAEFDKDGKAILKESMNPNKIGFTTLDGIDPDKENILSGDYSGQRNFNMFFRVKKDSNEYNITNYDFNTNTITTDVSSLSDTLKASYLFYNWALYSTEANDYITNESGELPFNSSTIDFTADYIKTYVDNTNLNSDKIRIEIIGSTSANEIAEGLTKIFEDDINTIYGSNSIEFVIATNGSGDAFKTTVPGVDEPYIGLQSREAKATELSSWGYDGIDPKTYHAFAIDAILIIYNKEHLGDKTIKYDVNHEDLNNLYESNDYIQWENVFKPFAGGGS